MHDGALAARLLRPRAQLDGPGPHFSTLESTMAAKSVTSTRLEELACRVYAEFAEMPGMHLTFDQVRRLGNLSAADCEQVLAFLVGAGLLRQDAHLRFCQGAASARGPSMH
jgi:hypothetical protein